MTAVSAGLPLPCLAARQYLHSPLEQTPGHSSSLSAQQASQMAKGVPRMRDPFLFHSSLPGVQIPSCFFFPPVLPSYMGFFLAALVVKDLLPAFSWFSVRIVPCVHVFLMCSLGDELIFFLCCPDLPPLVSHLITIQLRDSHKNAFLSFDLTASTASRGQTQVGRTGYSLLVKQGP